VTEIGDIRKVSAERIVSKIGERAPEKKMSANSPIGMFDSGVGGLTVLRAVMSELPHEDVVYFADTARVPYGGRSPQEIMNINHEIIGHLMAQGAKLIVMACGTSSSIAYPVLKNQYKIPMVGLIGPGSVASARMTRSGKIGLIATVRTVESESFPKEIKSIKPGIDVFSQSCPLFVPLIEGGFIDAEETKRAAREYLKPLQEAGVDTLILGCTHYPHLTNIIREIMGPEVALIDPALEAAKEVKKTLKKEGLLADRTSAATYTYEVSGSAPQFEDLGSRLLGKPIASARKVNLVAKRGSIE